LYHGERARRRILIPTLELASPRVGSAPDPLYAAIDPVELDALSRLVCLAHDTRHSQLSRELPSAMDCITADGRLPAH